MKLVSRAEDRVTLSMSLSELATLNNALNEMLNTVEDWELHTRSGATPEDARQLLAAIGQILGQRQG
jgi:hypothetical protein